LLAKYGAAPEHRRARRAFSAIFWGIGVPALWLSSVAWSIASGSATPVLAATAGAMVAYTYLLAKIRRRYTRAGRTPADARAYAYSCVFAKLPETWGMVSSIAKRASGRTAHWIEYKDDPQTIAGGAGADPS
jgi:hypothetical protein